MTRDNGWQPRIIRSDDNPTSRLTNPEFISKVWSERTREGVGQALSGLMRYKERVAIKQLETGYLKEAPEFGTVHALEIKKGKSKIKELAVITDVAFAEALYDHTELDHGQSIDLAASFVCGFGHVSEKIRQAARHHRTIKAPKSTFSAELWFPVYETAPNGLLALPYRAAATLALRASGIEDLVFGMAAPHPPHIAALENPLTPHEILDFHSILR